MRNIDDAIASAISRGAITEGRAAYWRAQGDGAADLLDTLAGIPVLAAAAPRAAVAYGMPPAMQPPAGADPSLYSANPILDELRRDRPGLVAIAMREDPNPPKLFEDADLPPFTASGIDPSVLAGLPWPLRRPVAAAATRVDAYRLIDKYAGAPDMARADLATAGENADYVGAMSLWLRGSGPPPVSYANPQVQAGAGDDYSTEALHRELFGSG
jgi:hypothetical protein